MVFIQIMTLLDTKHKLFRSCNAGPWDRRGAIEECLEEKRRRTGWNMGMKPIGLIGGGGDRIQSQDNNLRLMNNRTLETRNICFVNSVIQLLRGTGYESFLKMQLEPVLIGATGDSYKLCRALADLYCAQNRGEASAASVRKCVAEHSKNAYLDDGSQQDAEEFLR